jgi:hypothetical protein
MKTTNLNYTQAYGAMENGEKIKLPEWTGYWYMEGNIIKVCTRKGEILETPYIADYKTRTDWAICDGSRDFGGALTALKAGKKVARKGWNGKGMFILIAGGYNVPKENLRPGTHITAEFLESRGVSEMAITQHIDMWTADNKYVSGWLASQTDMLAEDWVIVE